jgi:hypothetical protein
MVSSLPDWRFQTGASRLEGSVLHPATLLKRSLIFIHRWLGVALSILFMLWFCSGIVMMYWSFPGVTREDRLKRAPVLNPAQVKLTPEEAWAALHRETRPGGVTLTLFDGRPVYRFSVSAGGGRGRRGDRGGADQAMVFADDGGAPEKADDAVIDRAAVAWAGQPLAAATKESLEEVDQWTVAGELRTLRPLFKYSFADGQQVYVSGRDAEVVQYTTSESRFWAYLGAIPHWLYFTPLRKNQPQWFQFVVWTSGVGTVAAILGIVIAIWVFSPSRKYSHGGAPTSIPYTGWKRWHTIIGLVFGVITATWAFSGLLSMGPFEVLDRLAGNTRGRGARQEFNVAGALRGAKPFDLAAFSGKSPQDALASIAGGFQSRELEFTMFAGEPVYMATDGTGATRIIPLNGEPRPEFDRERIMDIVRKTAGNNLEEVRVMGEYDAYYLDRRHELPLPVIYARIKDENQTDENQTRFYIDPKTGQVAGNYSSRNWVNRWLYHGLHSLDFPWLYRSRPLWDIVVITLMLGGVAVCLTSLVLAWRVLQRKVVALLPSGRVE